jgi:hypothetical protein
LPTKQDFCTYVATRLGVEQNTEVSREQLFAVVKEALAKASGDTYHSAHEAENLLAQVPKSSLQAAADTLYENNSNNSRHRRSQSSF